MLQGKNIFLGISALRRSPCLVDNALCTFVCKRHLTACKSPKEYNMVLRRHTPNLNTKLAAKTLRTRSRATPNTSTSSLDMLLQEVDKENEPPSRKPHDVVKSVSTVSDNFSIDNSAIESFETKSYVSGKEIATQMRQQKVSKTEAKNLSPVQKAIRAFHITDYTYSEDQEIAKHIRRRVIYADKNLVIFNKPYGLPVHDGDGTSHNIKKLLPMVSRMVYGISTNIPLALCNRLDKNTTGVIVCSTNPELERHIKKMFRMHLVHRKIWAILVGVPHPKEGIIDIPIGTSLLTDKLTSKEYSRMVAKPKVRYDPMTGEETPQNNRGGQVAITKYRVVDFRNHISLVEFEPETVTKHQLRVHAADCLGCPILGDHKYSRINSLSPQKLPPPMLKRFQLPQTKTRYVPMHLHQSQILIPDVFKDQRKRHLVVGARVPAHFERTMKLYGLEAGVPSPWKVKVLPPADLEAPPNDPSNPLYRDPTKEVEEAKEGASDTKKDCVFIFREQINVKYKGF